jgi:hypothetical protein
MTHDAAVSSVDELIRVDRLRVEGSGALFECVLDAVCVLEGGNILYWYKQRKICRSLLEVERRKHVHAKY